MANIFQATSEQVTAERANIDLGIVARMTHERVIKNSASDALAAIIGTLNKHRKYVAKLDGTTLAYVHHNPRIKSVLDDGTVEHITYADVFTSQRRAAQCFNEKAIPKVFTAARVLNGSVFFCKGNDDETLAGVVLALGEGLRQGKLIKNYLCDYMNRADTGRTDWHSQDTQGSSSLRALEALGVVKRVDGKGTVWDIADNARFMRLHEGALGVSYEAPLPTPDEVVFPGISDEHSAPAGWEEVSAGIEGTSLEDALAALNTDPVCDAPLQLTFDSAHDTAMRALSILATPVSVTTVAPAKRSHKAKAK